MVEIINQNIAGGIAGKRAGNPKGVVIHNDYGAMTAKEYIPWLIRRRNAGQLELGFAHYYIDRSTIARIEDTYNGAWATANKDGNMNYISYEVCQSYYGVISDALFKENEAMVFRQAAEDLQFYKLPINRNTVRLHKEFTSTSCPHRSSDIHGHSINAVKDYYISQVAYYASKGKTVQEMLKNEGKTESTAPAKPVDVTPQNDGKTLKVGKQAKQWETGSNIPAFVIGATYDVLASKPVNKSRSKKAYLIGKGKVATGWLLEQDVDGFKQAGGGSTTVNKPADKPAIGVTTQTESIAGVQTFLNTWFNAGLKVDGLIGPATKRAIVRAVQTELNKQFKAGIGVDGLWGPATQNAWATVRKGAKGNLSRLIQAALICKGYGVNGFDGDFQGGLYKAVIAFQSRNGLDQDGAVGKITAGGLFR